MPDTFDNQRTLELRKAPRVGIRIICDGTTIMEFSNDRTFNNLVSVSLVLRGVETKLDNPELQASTIEIEAYYNGSISNLLQFRGKETVIQYKCAYDDGYYDFWDEDNTRQQYVGIRAFYATFDEDGLQIENDHLIRIKGTDNIGTVSGDGSWALNFSCPVSSHTMGNNNYYYLAELMEWHMNIIRGSALTDQRLIAFYSDVYGPSGYMLNNVRESSSSYRTAPYYYYSNYLPSKSQRKRIAEWVNIFRGIKTQNPNATHQILKRLVFRDAGSPFLFWTRNAVHPYTTSRFQLYSVNSPSNSRYYDIWLNDVWNISYSEVSDLKMEYGNTVNKLIIDNPFVKYVQVSETYDAVPDSSTVIHRENVSQYRTYATSGWGSVTRPTISIQTLDEKSFVLKVGDFDNTGISPKITITFYEAVYAYANNATKIPDFELTTGLAGDIITLDPLYTLRHIAIYSGSTATTPSYEMDYIKEAYNRVLNDNNLKQPRWITFTWRGHPGMHPRDIILFTEKNGTQNYYEVDSLTLEHKDGGLVSTVKAIYKYQYEA